MFYTYDAGKERREKFVLSDSSAELPPPPPPLFFESYYSKHNIVIDSLGCLYYFMHKDRGGVCGTGFDHDSIYPASFISLSPKDLILIPKNGIDKFIWSNITDSLKLDSPVYVMVGSARDSFYSPELSKIALAIENKSGHIILRRTTQEEEVVLDHKKKGIPYNPKLIIWNPEKTVFPYICP